METRYAVLFLSALLLFAAAAISPAHARMEAAIYPRTDKASYLPGDSGTLLITIRNDGEQAFTLNNMTVDFPWKAYFSGSWSGNETRNNINYAIASRGGSYDVPPVSFTVPSDGRAGFIGGTGLITIHSDDFPYIDWQTFSVIVAVPAYQTGPVGSIVPYLEILLQVATVLLLFLVFTSIRRIPK